MSGQTNWFPVWFVILAVVFFGLASLVTLSWRGWWHFPLAMVLVMCTLLSLVVMAVAGMSEM